MQGPMVAGGVDIGRHGQSWAQVAQLTKPGVWLAAVLVVRCIWKHGQKQCIPAGSRLFRRERLFWLVPCLSGLHEDEEEKARPHQQADTFSWLSWEREMQPCRADLVPVSVHWLQQLSMP